MGSAAQTLVLAVACVASPTGWLPLRTITVVSPSGAGTTIWAQIPVNQPMQDPV